MKNGNVGRTQMEYQLRDGAEERGGENEGGKWVGEGEIQEFFF